MATILVTGGCGFIGREAVGRLAAAGHDVRVLDNLAYADAPGAADPVTFTHGSVGDRDVLRRAFDGVDTCVHLAGSPVLHDPRAALSGDAEPFIAAADGLFAEAHAAGVRMIYASSAAVYGNAQSQYLNESHPTAPVNAHGAEKLALERVARRYADDHGLPSIGLRMFNVFGPGQSPASPYCGVVRLFAEKIVRGEEAVIRGDGGQARDFIYVMDAAEAISRAVDSRADGGHLVNICTGRSVTIMDVVHGLEQAMGRTLRRRMEPETEAGVRVSVGDPARARALFDFTAEISFADGVARMVHVLTAEPPKSAPTRA